MAELIKKTTKAKKEVAEKKATIKAVKKEVLENKTTGTLSIGVVDMDGKAAGTVTLPLGIFGAKVNPILMAQAVRVYLANQRQGTARTQTRGEVTASKRKIYKQKGTGRARHGALSAPLFVGGGTTFGPKPRDFSLKMPTKMKRAALFSALTQKFVNKQVMVLDVSAVSGKTKQFAETFKTLNLLNSKGKVNKVLIVVDNTESLKKAVRNVDGVDVTNVSTLSTYSILNHRNILFVKDTIGKMEEIYVKEVKAKS
jgi:large subunit ribosomal protein L4